MYVYKRAGLFFNTKTGGIIMDVSILTIISFFGTCDFSHDIFLLLRGKLYRQGCGVLSQVLSSSPSFILMTYTQNRRMKLAFSLLNIKKQKRASHCPPRTLGVPYLFLALVQKEWSYFPNIESARMGNFFSIDLGEPQLPCLNAEIHR